MNVCVLSIIDKWRIIMALIQMSLMSQSLLRTVPVSVVLPADKMIIKGKPVRENKPYKTLYLLHGIYGSNMDWNLRGGDGGPLCGQLCDSAPLGV